jgi:hypothetical protein
MRIVSLTILMALLASTAALAQNQPVFRWVDSNGLTHYGDSIPAEYAELPKQVLNEHGVAVGQLDGKKTPEQIEAERIENEKRVAMELRQRADQALLATYLSIEEILMHRDRRVELFQAQSRVTELYLSNLSRRMERIRNDASRYSPYSEDSSAPMIPEELANDLRKTKDTIARHEQNLEKFLEDEQQIIARFGGDISRFKLLKGIE